MGLIFEDLIRRFNEASNETAGDHFTPREVIRLMVNLLFTPDSQILPDQGHRPTLYDPACGTGGMLSVAEEYLRELNPDARLEVFGQDYNNEAFAICSSDMMIKGQNPENIKFGDSFTQDGLPGQEVRLPAGESAVRRRVEAAGRGDRDGARRAGIRRPLRRRPAAHQRRLAPLPHAHDLEDEAGRLAPGDRLQRLAAVHRRCRLGRERNSPLDHRERLAGSHRRPAGPRCSTTPASPPTSGS